MTHLTIQQMFDLAVQHHQAGRLQEAEQFYRQILAQQPKHAGALHYQGMIAYRTKQTDTAIDLLRQAIALEPNWPDAHSNLGVVLQAQGDLDRAIAAYHQALALQPNYPEVHYNLGTALKDKGLLHQAIAAWRATIALKPDFAAAYSDLGVALKDTGQLDAAITACRQAVAIKPGFSAAHSNLVLVLHYHPSYNALAIAQEHRRWNQQHAKPLEKHILPHANNRDPNRRLRVGYVSPDLCNHPVGRFLLPLLENHDHQNVEIVAYAQVPVPDATTEHLRSHADAWRDLVGLSDAQAADLIRQDGIDILVDLTLHTANNRLLLFARKPAPVQVTYLAYVGTSGLTTMDYRLSDPYLDPPGEDESIYSEQTIRLPETYWCYRPAVYLPLQAPPMLENGFVTFGCLNSFCKVNEPLLDLWSRLLAAVPHSRLLLHTYQGGHRQRVLDYLQARGIEASRISFVGQLPTDQYFQQYNCMDIALDTHPYGGGTTTCDTLWMGVPVVSLVGKTAVGRGGLSILSNIGLPELAAKTPDEYVQIAVNLANDLPRLKELRSTMRQRMEASPLLDAPRFARNVEAAYRQMWQKWCVTAAGASA